MLATSPAGAGTAAPTFTVELDIRDEQLGGDGRAEFGVLNADLEIVFESNGTQVRPTIDLPAGQYYFAVFNARAVDDDFPLFAEWHDGSPFLTLDQPVPVTISGSTTLIFELSPFFNDFEDASETFIQNIIWLRDAGITTGCSPTKYCPKDSVLRGQMAAFLDRALQLPTGPPSGFTDTAGTFQNNINDLKAAGITTGCSPTLFCTNDPVTREQMAAFLFRSLEPTWGIGSWLSEWTAPMESSKLMAAVGK